MSDFFDDVFTAYCNSYNECASCPLGKETGECVDLFKKRVIGWAKAHDTDKFQNPQVFALEAVRRRIVDTIARVEGMQKGLDHALTFVNEAIWELGPIANEPAKHAEGGKDE